MGRVGERRDGVGAVSQRVGPALALHEATGVALVEEPCRDPVAPGEHPVRGEDVGAVVAFEALGEHQRGETAAEDTVGARLADTGAQAGHHAVAQPREEVVVDAAADPAGQDLIGGAVTAQRVGAAQHRGEFRGEVVEGTVGRNLEPAGSHLVPVARCHTPSLPASGVGSESPMRQRGRGPPLLC